MHEIGHFIHRSLFNAKTPEDFNGVFEKVEADEKVDKEFLEFKKLYMNTKEMAKRYALDNYDNHFDELVNFYEEDLKKIGLSEDVINIVMQQTITKDEFLEKQKNVFCSQIANHYMLGKNPSFYQISDILDSIYKGKIKSREGMFGHGEEFYKDSERRFREIFACYFSISHIQNSDHYINFLTNIVGKDFVEYMENFLNQLMTNSILEYKETSIKI